MRLIKAGHDFVVEPESEQDRIDCEKMADNGRRFHFAVLTPESSAARYDADNHEKAA